MSVKLTSLKTGNLGEQTYEVLVDALMKGTLHAGDRIRIAEIADQLGTSITPVRDAVLRLVNDEALVMRNARDIRVPSISATEYIEIRNIRMELEGLAAEQAARNATPDDIANLARLLQENERAIKKRDHAAGTAANQAFHAELALIGQAPILRGVLRRLWMRAGPFISDAYGRGGRMLNEHHDEILQAIKNRDPKRARDAVRRDILEGSNAVLAASGAKPVKSRRA
ncbi:MAG: GntR family transcriptional regulator [Gammaproteobacteria bacterium]|nr:GntR family transcriptional regulator [Gammaproteobacteria bacterium]